MRVDDWFTPFLSRHMIRHPLKDWPNYARATEFYDGWRRLLIRVGADEAVADEASEQLMASPPWSYGDHPKALADAITAIYKTRPRQDTEGLEPREEALRLSRDCWDCDGEGLTIRYRHKSAEPGRTTITLYCLCPYGRFLERTHKAQNPEVRKRIYDLADHPWLQGENNKFRFPEGTRIFTTMAELVAYMKEAANDRFGKGLGEQIERRYKHLGTLPPFVPEVRPAAAAPEDDDIPTF